MCRAAKCVSAPDRFRWRSAGALETNTASLDRRIHTTLRAPGVPLRKRTMARVERSRTSFSFAVQPQVMFFGGQRIDPVLGQPLTILARTAAASGCGGLGWEEQRGVATNLTDDAQASVQQRQDEALSHVPAVDEHARTGCDAPAANRAMGLPGRVFYALHCQKNAGARDSQLSGLAEVKAVSAL
jgi:hypothetical protein